MTVELNRKDVGGWVVESILPFFKIVLLVSLTAPAVAAVTGNQLDLVHALTVPSLMGVLYAIYDVDCRRKQRAFFGGYERHIITVVTVGVSVGLVYVV